MDTGRKKVFVAVVTGQKVANYPPILQFSEQGDHVLWLVSEGASKWFGEADKKFLKSKGIDYEEVTVSDLYSPRDVGNAILSGSELLKQADAAAEVYFILNGGQKLTPIGLQVAGSYLSEKGHEVFYLHGDYPSCKLRMYRKLDREATPCELKYNRVKMLGLKEIVELNNRTLGAPKYSWSYDEGSCKDFPQPDNSEYVEKVREFRILSNKEELSDIEKKKRCKLEKYIGQTFELLVFNRMVTFLSEKRNDYEPVIKELVCQAKFSTSTTEESDFDVGLVLLNGAVLNFECKSGNFKRKDIESRISLLRKSTSNIASLVLVVPLLMDSEGQMKEEVDRIQRRDLWKIDFLPYTLPDYKPSQLKGLIDPIPKDFESELEKILKQYLP